MNNEEEQIARTRLVIEEIQQKADPAILDNPRFVELCKGACSEIFKSTGRTSFSVKVSEDGKDVLIYDESKYVLSPSETWKNNKYFCFTNISLSGNHLTSESGAGLLRKADNTKENIPSSCGSVLHTWYEYSDFDENGIEMVHSEFNDYYPMPWLKNGESLEDQPVKNEVFGSNHRPTFTFERVEPPMFCNNAKSVFASRQGDNLGLVTYIKTEGIMKGPQQYMNQGKTTCEIGHNRTDNPQDLSCLSIATFNPDTKEFEYNGQVIDRNKASEEAKNIFKAGLETSKVKQSSPKMYEALLAKVNGNEPTK